MRFVALLLLASCVSFACAAEPEPEPALDAWRPYAGALADSRSRTITSEITGRTYEISVALPLGYETTEATYPVLYAVDANGELGTVVEAARLMRFDGIVPDLLIVGIGYPVGRFFDATPLRAVDLTPTEDPEFLRWWSEELPDFPPLEGTGGAPGFLDFIRQELIPLVESEYRAESSGRALFGHSFGGLFALYALFQGEGTFERFIVGSPSLFWDDRATFDFEAAYAETHATLEADLFLAVGLLEALDGEEYAMVSNVEDLATILEARNYEGLRLETMFFEDETHTSVIPPTVSRGLRVISQAWER
ncbi:MAG: alpha/beta hydrolase-fold protein [Gemmatimonadota bacterium]